MNLSTRLLCLRSFYNNETEIWDIGCDHALLGLSFASEEKINSIYLVDASLKVIETLKDKIDSYMPLSKVFILLNKGQKLTLSKNKKCIFIAGMGGKEIIEILKNLSTQISEDDRIVISPHRKILETREYLSNSDFRCLDEQVITEDNQFYQIICLSTLKSLPKVSLYGERMWQSEAGRAYCIHQKMYFSKHMDLESRAYITYLNQIS